jgi:endonuclease YncB( thermonuclease family)
LPTVKACTPGSPGYRETAAGVRGPGAYRVIDGDTIEAAFGVKYRLLGFDTPEIFHSPCDAELELGMAAKERLEELFASGEVRVIESGRTDKYRRTLAHVEVNGRDVGEILIREGLARPYKGERRKSWCE